MAEAINNTARQRHGMVAEASMAYVTYARKDGRIALVHTEVPSALAGRGVGSALARSVLEDARRLRLKIVPECAFIAEFIKRHPEFEDLVAGSDEDSTS